MTCPLPPAALLLWLTFVAAAAAARADGPPPSPAARLDAIRAGVAAAEDAMQQAWAKLPEWEQDNPNVARLAEAADQKRRAGFAAALEIARADPASGVGFEALEWLMLQAPGVYSDPAGVPALHLLLAHHAGNPKVGRLVATVGYYPPFRGLPQRGMKAHPAYAPAIDLLKAIAERNPDRTARGQAALGLAWQAREAYDVATLTASPDAGRLKVEAERAYEAVAKDYGDCPYLRETGRWANARLGEIAGSALFDLRNLQPGHVAPEVAGEDLGGAALRLGDHRGTVVLLVFWASWCGPCMADVPHERALVERFNGRPFVLLGVNGDEDKDKAAKAVARHGISWRSFWNGPKGSGGPIAAAWNVRGWPTVYVIDHRGVIRHNNLRGTDLDEPLAELVAEAEAKPDPVR